MKNLIFIFSLLLAINGFGQIKENLAIDSIFSEWSKPNVPGCVLGIIRDGKLIYAKGYGMANLEKNIPNDINSVFEIASTSKQFTAACIVLLAEQGKLDLDNKLSDFFPEFPDYANQITIRHLLNHTSGIRNDGTLAFLKSPGNNDICTDSAIMKLLANQKELNFKPGDKYEYSNTGYWLLGQIVNKVAKMDLADFSRKEIFEPLGMNSTLFYKDHSKILKNQAYGYESNGTGGFKINMSTSFDHIIGSKGIFTNIEDIKKWDDAFYQSDILNKKFWSMMLQPGILNNGDTLDYACALVKGNYKGLNKISHGGAFLGYRSDILRFPDQRLTVVIFANRADADPTKMCYKVADVLLKDQFIVQKSTAKDIEPKDNNPEGNYSLEQLTGMYALRPDMILNISLKNDSLNVIQSWNNNTYKIVKIKGDTFQVPGITDLSFTFLDLQNGKTMQLSVFQFGQNTFWKRKKDIDLTKINPKEFAGKYYSKELDVVYEFSVKKNKLHASAGKFKQVEIFAYDIDQFYYGNILIRFKRDGNLISGLEIDAEGVNNLKFEKMKK